MDDALGLVVLIAVAIIATGGLLCAGAEGGADVGYCDGYCAALGHVRLSGGREDCVCADVVKEAPDADR